MFRSLLINLANSPAPTPPQPANDYFTIVPHSAGTLTCTQKGNGTLNYKVGDNGSWTAMSSGSAISFSANDEIRFKGNLSNSTSPSGTGAIAIGSDYGIGRFSSTFDFTAKGNIMSLLFGDNYDTNFSLSGYPAVFNSLFAEGNIVHASQLLLPATTLSVHCYTNMFNVCTKLEDAPLELPAITLPTRAYCNMFRACYLIPTMPDIKATTIDGASAMGFMFAYAGIRRFECNITTLNSGASGALGYICFHCANLEEVVVPSIAALQSQALNSAFAYCIKTNYWGLATPTAPGQVTSGFVSDVVFKDASGNNITLGNDITADDFVGLRKITFPDNFPTSNPSHAIQYILVGNKALKEIRWKNTMSEGNAILKYVGHTSLNGEQRTVKGKFIAGVNSTWGTSTSGYNSQAFDIEKTIV